MSNIIDSIRMSGTTYAISDSGGTKVVEITQSDYDNLPTSAKTANIMYVITDAEPFDVSNYYTKAETSGATELATAFAATQPKLSAGTNITIDENNVISAEGGGGGKAVSGGTNISITTGETADTINCTLPITATSSAFSTISIGKDSGGGEYNTLIGPNAKCDHNSRRNVFLVAQYSTSSNEGSYVKGSNNVIIGSMKTGYPSWDIPSFSTSQSVVIGGGQMSTDKNNSLAIGYNANVSGTTKTNINNQLTIDTSNQVYIYNKDNTEMICLQDQLGGGGGSSYTAGDGIDITNDVISVTGKVDTSAFTAHTADTVIHVTSAEKAAWNAKSDFSGNYNDLSNKPTIPTSTSQLTNDSGYITSSALDGYATEDYVTATTNDMATKTWVGQQGYLTEHQSLSNYYTKSETSGATEISTALGNKADTTAVTQSINEAVSGKANSADIVDITGFGTQNSDTLIMTREKNGSMIAPLTVVKAGSGLSISVDAWANKSFDVDTTVIQEKLVSGTNIKTINNESILGSGNIDIQGGGGGKSVTGGTNISVTTGETADTINCTLPISADSKGIYTTSTYPFLSTSNKSGNVVFGYNNRLDTFGSTKSSNYNLFFGSGNHITVNGSGMLVGGINNQDGGNYSDMTACVVLGGSNRVGNPYEFASGQFNQAYYGSQSFGNSGNTLFSVGNGWSSSSRHSAFEIRQNGDIYVPNMDDTSTTNWYQKPMVRLQDTITATAANTTALGGLKLVKLSQSEYDSLATKDNSTLYVIVN